MKKICLLFCFFILLIIKAQGEIAHDKKIIPSKYLGEDREIWIHLPKNYHTEAASKDKYPVVYLLDAETNFDYTVAMTSQMSAQPYAEIPESIIIGIKNTKRTRDFTPTKSSMDDPYQKGNKLFADSGGAESFLNFMEKELKPYVAENYRVLDFSIFIGHSFGGLAVINSFLERPEMFNAYVANDPSLWWDNAVLVKKLSNINFKDKKFSKKILLLAQAYNTDYNKSWNSDHIKAIEDFNSILGSTNHNFDYNYKFYSDEQHGSIPLPANHNALKYIYRGFQTDIRRSPEDPTEFILKPYKLFSERTGVNFTPTVTYLEILKDFAKRKGNPKSAEYFETLIKQQK